MSASTGTTHTDDPTDDQGHGGRAPARLRARGPRGRGGGARDRVEQAELRQGALPRPVPPRPGAPAPAPRRRRRGRGEAFLARLREVCAGIDGARIEREARIPDEDIKALAEHRRVRHEDPHRVRRPRAYDALLRPGADAGRLGAPGVRCAAVGAPVDRRARAGQALRHRRSRSSEFLPRCAAGAISAFLLTEPDVGSDPARLGRTATLTDDGTAYLLNGVKLWTTNGVVAELLVVMAAGARARGRARRHLGVRRRGRRRRASRSSGATPSWACAASRTA